MDVLLLGFLQGWQKVGRFLLQMIVSLFVGVLGGFTTFSSVALETLWLARGSQGLAALTNIGLRLFLGMVAVWIGDHSRITWEVDLTTALGTN